MADANHAADPVVLPGMDGSRTAAAAGLGRWAGLVLGLAALLPGAGCAPSMTNPAYSITHHELHAEIQRLRREPAPPDRPVVILGGWRTPSWSARGMARRIRRLTGAAEESVLPISYPLEHDFARIAADVVERVESRWPCDDPERTVEVDVIGISMGGLVARTAALRPAERPGHRGPPTGKRLRIRRLFTLGTPHRGAKLAPFVPLDPAARQMRPGSPLVRRLDERLADVDYELVCYARLNDRWVGARNAAPPGHESIWVPGPILFSHQTITTDRRILADLARRLRHEPPLATGLSVPPCD